MPKIDERKYSELTDKLKKAVKKLKDVPELQSRINKIEEEINKITAVGSRLHQNLTSRSSTGFTDNETAVNFLKFHKAVVDGDVALARSLSEGDDGAGGYLVRDEFSAVLMELTKKDSLFLSKCKKVRQTKPTKLWPAPDGGAVAYVIGEGQAPQESTPSFKQIESKLVMIGALSAATHELLDDADIDVANYIAGLHSNAAAALIDHLCMFGSVANGDPFDGLANHPDVIKFVLAAGKTQPSQMDLQDLTRFTAAAKKGSKKDKFLIMNYDMPVELSLLVDTTGRPLTTGYLDPIAEKFRNFPYYEHEGIADNADIGANQPFMFFVDPNSIFMAEGGKLAINTSDHALFMERKRVFLTTYRFSFIVSKAESCAVAYTAAS